MDERRAINQATISDHGGAAACTGLQKPLAGFTEATRHGTMKAKSNSVDLFTISPSASEEQHADVIDLDKMMVLHIKGLLHGRRPSISGDLGKKAYGIGGLLTQR